jgi:membrane-associated protease RseP (regulator of RpoE activity)
MSQNSPLPLQAETTSSSTACKNCHSPMPSELRFCRNCGCRLGEGSAEYTETVRFPNGASGTAGNFGNASPFGTGAGQMVPNVAGPIGRKKKRLSGMTWIFLAIVIFFISGGLLTRLARPSRRGLPLMAAPAPLSYFGINRFKNTDGGVTFDTIESPGSPADKAGLVGGDIITTFDGHPVSSEAEMKGRLMETPIGKTLDVVYIRDGETKTTKLTTISKGDLDRLGSAFGNRPEGRGRFGYETSDAERVEVVGTKLHGVRLGSISASLPADMAGIKNGDVVIEFDGVPIRTPEEFESRVRRAMPYTTVDVTVMRGVERIVIPVKMGRQ